MYKTAAHIMYWFAMMDIRWLKVTQWPHWRYLGFHANTKGTSNMGNIPIVETISNIRLKPYAFDIWDPDHHVVPFRWPPKVTLRITVDVIERSDHEETSSLRNKWAFVTIYVCLVILTTMGIFYQDRSSLIRGWICNYIDKDLWNVITYPTSNSRR